MDSVALQGKRAKDIIALFNNTFAKMAMRQGG